MAMKNDLTGQVYGKLTVLKYHGKDKHGVSVWLCRCDCGKEKNISSMSMRSGKTKSCGCFRAAALKNGREELVAKQKTHGKTHTPEFRILMNMIYRCENSNAGNFDLYGKRGISVCARWKNSFGAFLEDMGPRPSPQHSIDRIDNNGNYEPGNCRWVTAREQSINRRDSRMLTHNGETKNLVVWAQEFGMDKATLHGRLKRGWSIQKALETPPNKLLASRAKK